VRPEGIEPPTLGLEIRCSIRLSYGRKLFAAKYKFNKRRPPSWLIHVRRRARGSKFKSHRIFRGCFQTPENDLGWFFIVRRRGRRILAEGCSGLGRRFRQEHRKYGAAFAGSGGATNANRSAVHPGMRIFEVSAKTGFGMEEVVNFLSSHIVPLQRPAAA
jgi:hypothetical protein